MIDVSMALKNRIQRFMQAYTTTTVAAYAGGKTLTGTPAEVAYFDVIGLTKSNPKIGILPADGNTVIFNKIHSVDRDAGTIQLTSPLAIDVPLGSVVKRTPGWTEINTIILGDVEVVNSFPAIIISPNSMQREFRTLGVGTNEVFNINIGLYVMEDGHENSMLTLMGATQELDDLLMADLHLPIPTVPGGQPGYATQSKVSSINYTYVQKGSSFIKGAELSWEATTFIIRHLISHSVDYEHFYYYPGDPF